MFAPVAADKWAFDDEERLAEGFTLGKYLI